MVQGQWAMGNGIGVGVVERPLRDRSECLVESIRSYKDLVAWQRAYAVGLAVYRLTKSFPSDERFALTSQIRRSAISIASNIAEGYGRGSQKDYVRFLRVARASLMELETQLQFARDLGYLPEAGFSEISSKIDEAAKPLSGLIRSVER